MHSLPTSELLEYSVSPPYHLFSTAAFNIYPALSMSVSCGTCLVTSTFYIHVCFMSFFLNCFAKSNTVFFSFLIAVHENTDFPGIPHTNHVSIS